MLGTHSPHSPGYSPLRRRNSGGLLQKTVARRTILISFLLLCVSGTLNIGFLFSRLIPSTTDKAQLVDQLAESVVVPECPSVDCNRVCARHAYQAERTAARQDACDVDGAATGGSSTRHGRTGKQLEDILLFVGALSGRGYRHRRLAVRDAWGTLCQKPGVSVCRFIMSDDEVSPLVEEEMKEYQDIVLVHGETTYKSILLKSLFVFEYALRHYDVRFVLKTDDDAFVNVPYLTAQLRMLCGSPDCRQERLYMGNLCTDGEVFTQPGHKWNNGAYANHTGLKTYANYMLGGGYIMSADVVRALLAVKDSVALKFTPIEDATIGMWLMPMDLRHVHHPRINTMYWPCCFKDPVRRPGEDAVTGFELTEETEKHICTDDPWIILHKLDSPTKMRYIGQRFASCAKKPDEKVVPASLAGWVAAIGASEEQPASVSEADVDAVEE